MVFYSLTQTTFSLPQSLVKVFPNNFIGHTICICTSLINSPAHFGSFPVIFYRTTIARIGVPKSSSVNFGTGSTRIAVVISVIRAEFRPAIPRENVPCQ